MNPDDIQEAKRKRFQFLRQLYEVTEGNQYSIVSVWKLGEDLGFPKEETDRITDYLQGEGLMKFQTFGGGASITHEGVVEVERALSEPDRPTEYFPPANVIYVEKMVGSQIQQGTNQSAQTMTYTEEDLQAISSFIQNLKSQLPDLHLEEDQNAEVESEVATVEAQLGSPRPRWW